MAAPKEIIKIGSGQATPDTKHKGYALKIHGLSLTSIF
jgi:hypothetical protein